MPPPTSLLGVFEEEGGGTREEGERLCALLDEAVEAGAGAAAIAEAVAEEARAAGARSDWQSPFAAAARKYGFSHSGGKLDDVTVVCVKVLDAAATGGPAAAQTRSRL